MCESFPRIHQNFYTVKQYLDDDDILECRVGEMTFPSSQIGMQSPLRSTQCRRDLQQKCFRFEGVVILEFENLKQLSKHLFKKIN